MKAPATLRFYRLFSRLATPFVWVLLTLRLRAGKEDPARIGERRGKAGLPRPPGPLVWLHGASVGEAVSLLPFVERLTRSGCTALVTTGTVSSAELLAQRLPAGAIHQYAPLDLPRFVQRFVRHWRPDGLMIAESEIWPNMIFEANQAGIPLVLINGRISERSYERWQRAPRFISVLLRAFDLCLAQGEADGERFQALGARHVVVAGNVKYDSAAPPADRRELAELAGMTSGRQIWVAASTHDSEETIAAKAHARLSAVFPDALTLIAPRHRERGEAIFNQLSAMGYSCALRSRGDPLTSRTAIYVCDTIGELGLFYRLAGVVFIGKTFKPGGGQNPIEAAKLACAILHGPEVENFAEAFGMLDTCGGAAEVAEADALGDALIGLFSDTAKLRAMARAAARAVDSQVGAVDRSMEAIAPLLPAVAG
jgi:3-deoxy-D-manno-octulosonic-acid transferase